MVLNYTAINELRLCLFNQHFQVTFKPPATDSCARLIASVSSFFPLKRKFIFVTVDLEKQKEDEFTFLVLLKSQNSVQFVLFPEKKLDLKFLIFYPICKLQFKNLRSIYTFKHF